MTDTHHIADMTPEQVRREIAERLGYKVVLINEEFTCDQSGSDGDKIYAGYYESFRLQLPDGGFDDTWPRSRTRRYWRTKGGKLVTDCTDPETVAKYYMESIDDKVLMLWSKIPNWPEDAAAALDLCLDIARRKGVVLVMDYSYSAGYRENISSIDGYFLTGPKSDSPAIALARLALVALREREVDR
jgi:hypothetical protein